MVAKPEGTKPQLKVKKELLAKAIRALHQLVAKRSANANPLFGSSSETMLLLFNLSQIPEKRKMRPVMIPLPNPLFDEKSEVCFISKDPQKKWKEMLMKTHPVPGITKVIGVDKLKRNYNSLQAKRALADAFDLFLCDADVAEMMPKILGKVFYQKKLKIPIPVKMFTQDPKPMLEKAIKGTTMRIPSGPCLGIKIGRCGMSEEQLVENAVAVIKGVISNVWDNPIQSITVQATDSPALPVWRRPSPPGGPVDLKKYHSDASSSSAASDTGISGASETEGTEYGELPSDAGETLSTRDTASEPGTPGDISNSELDSEAGDVDEEEGSTDKASMPLISGLKQKRGGKRRRGESASEAGKSPKASPKAAPKAASPKMSPKKAAEMLPPPKKVKKGKATK